MLLAVARLVCQTASKRGREARFRHAHVGGGRSDLLERGSDGGIVIERVLQRLLERERRRRAWRCPPGRARSRSTPRHRRQPRRDEFVSLADSVPSIGRAKQLASDEGPLTAEPSTACPVYYRISTIVYDNENRA